MIKAMCNKISLSFEAEVIYRETDNFVETYKEKITTALNEVKSEALIRISICPKNCEIYYVMACYGFDDLKKMRLHNILVELPDIIEVTVRDAKVINDQEVDFSIKDIVCHINSPKAKIILNVIFF